MKLLIGTAVAFSAIAVLALRPNGTPTAETVVHMPHDQLYASLDKLFSEIERKASRRRTVTGNPPVPVEFTFDREPGKMLSMEGVAGFRTVSIVAWTEEADTADQSLLKVRFEPESILEKSGQKDDLFRALKATLERTSNQFVDGQRITVLFGEGKIPTDSDVVAREWATSDDQEMPE